MSTIFISHVEEDKQIALQLALGLEENGYSTWCYELDSLPGISHMDQTLSAIETAEVFIIIISKGCIQSHEVTTELTRAQDHKKPIIPLLLNITHDEFSARRSEWVQRLGTVTCSQIPNDVNTLIPRLILSLNTFKVAPESSNLAERQKRIQNLKNMLAYKDIPIKIDTNEAALPKQAYKDRRSPKDILKKEFIFSGQTNLIDNLSDHIKTFLEKENLETQLIHDGRHIIVQGKKATKGLQRMLKSGFGLDLAITVVFEDKNGDLGVTIMPTKWMDKAIGMGIGMLIYWPAAVTAAVWGIVAMRQLISRIEQEINTYVK